MIRNILISMRNRYITRLILAVAFGASLTACVSQPSKEPSIASLSSPSTQRQFVDHYATMGYATYLDAYDQAVALQVSIENFLSLPNQLTLSSARDAWKLARVPYSQSEVYRFGNPFVDRWEGQVNAWPVDEGFIDYVDESQYVSGLGNTGADLNLLSVDSLSIGGNTVDLRQLDINTLSQLNEYGGSESNVVTGYHAIEFLLWGQDLSGPVHGAGNRHFSDYITGPECANPPCERRASLLRLVTGKLVSDLNFMQKAWSPYGEYRKRLLEQPEENGLKRMLYGIGSLALGELAGERLLVAMEAKSQEDEQDCFSDHTHSSIFNNALSLHNVYTGTYTNSNGERFQGPNLSSLVSRLDPSLDEEMKFSLRTNLLRAEEIFLRAEAEQLPESFDMLLAEGNNEGKQLIQSLIDSLTETTRNIERITSMLGFTNLSFDDHAG
ncbi:MAG: putative iron-regulated protein [Arenicella sp.]|jgi:putative iron-regulated protein